MLGKSATIILLLVFAVGCGLTAGHVRRPVANPSFASRVAEAGKLPTQDSTRENWEKTAALTDFEVHDLRSGSVAGRLLSGLAMGAAFGVLDAKGGLWRSSAHRVADGVLSGIQGFSAGISSGQASKLPGLIQRELAPDQQAWLEKNPAAHMLVWMPAEMASGPHEARDKLRRIIEQALERTPGGGGIRILRCGLPEKQVVPPIIARSIEYQGECWAWNGRNAIIFSPSLYDPEKRLIVAHFDDVTFWRQASQRMPVWCFNLLDALLTSAETHFLAYPQLVWQGKSYLFVEGAASGE